VKEGLGAVKAEKTLTQLTREYGIHQNQIGKWRKKLLRGLPSLFSNKRNRQEKDHEEVEWLKKFQVLCKGEEEANSARAFGDSDISP
jgi:putative transposase